VGPGLLGGLLGQFGILGFEEGQFEVIQLLLWVANCTRRARVQKTVSGNPSVPSVGGTPVRFYRLSALLE
jgi:hypothetical protein